MTKYYNALAAVVAICLIAPGSAHAYLDPATGSIILQIVLGGIAGLGVFGKLFWHRIRAFFGASATADSGDDSSQV